MILKFDELAELGITIPIKKQVEKLSLKYYSNWEKSLKSTQL